MKIKIMSCSWDKSLVGKTLDVKKVKSKITLEELAFKLDRLAERVESGFEQVNKRIDNLVVKNNLAE